MSPQATEPPAELVRGDHAPVLVVPAVLDREMCRRLIDYWNAGDKIEGQVSTSSEGAALRQGIKIRRDVPVLGPELGHPLRRAFIDRVVPEIRRAFQFEVTQFETIRVGCYDAAEGGFFGPHRDNTTPYTAHRKFACTLNLNTGEYDGGELRFPEYGSPPFAPAAGGAVIFSCALLHEALPVRRGRRFGVFTFFFDEAGAARVKRLLAAEAAKRGDIAPDGMISPGGDRPRG